MHHLLFCFPYAGGSSSYYRDWKINEVEVVPIEYPGHGSKYCEPFCQSVDELADLLVKDMTLHYHLTTAQSISFFGHSMGATIAFEVSKKLRDQYGIVPNHLFISSKSSPEHLLDEKFVTNDQLKEHLIETGGLTQELLKLEGLAEVFFPIIQADLKLLREYKTHLNQKLNTNATLFIGSNDSVTRESMESWSNYLSNINGIYTFDGDHFYLSKYKEKLFDIIRDALKADEILFEAIDSC